MGVKNLSPSATLNTDALQVLAESCAKAFQLV